MSRLVGLDGKLLAAADFVPIEPEPEEMVWFDKTQTYSKDNQQYSAKPKDILMAAARMQRDGQSLKVIKMELDVAGVSDAVLQRALNKGHWMLNQAIAQGLEPAESKILIPKSLAPLSPDDIDD